MVVLSAVVLTKTKPLIARQFVEMSRLRVEGLTSAFLKLVEHGGKDHTFIETESVRYVYQPMETLYVLLITNKSSNILEDLETLRLLQMILQDKCDTGLSEELVSANAFDIVFAFDEVISFGYRESVTLSQIRTFTEMDSHEEKLQEMIRRTKENEEKERRKQIAMQLDKKHAKQKREDKERARLGMAADYEPAPLTSHIPQLSAAESQDYDTSSYAQHTVSSPPLKATPGKGMQIGKKGPASIRGAMRTTPTSPPVPAKTEEPPAEIPVNPLLEPVKVCVQEKVVGELHTEGGLAIMNIDGTLEMTVADVTKAALACLKISPEDQRFKFRAHMNLNKTAQPLGRLELRDDTRPYKTNVSTQLLKWRTQTKDEDMLPLTISCWPSSSANNTYTIMAIEFEVSAKSPALNNLVFSFNTPTSTQVSSADVGDTAHDGHCLHWTVPIAEPGATGSIEFTTPSPLESLLPFNVEATSQETLCNIQVMECYPLNSPDESIRFLCSKESHFSFTVGQL